MGTTDFEDRTAGEDGGPFTLSRRKFLGLAGAGIVICFTVGDWGLLEAQERRRDYPADFNAYLRIGEDGRVTVYSGKVELGQGVITALAQMAAEELGVALESIDMVMGDTRSCPYDMGTFGSMSVRFFGPALRGAAAEARAVLVELAAERLAVPKEQLGVENGVVFVTRDRARHVSFGELAKGRAIERHLTGKPALRPVASWTRAGRPERRTDARAKATGEAKYAGDIRLPGMLYARVLRPPAHGARLVRVDTSAAAAMAGVTVFDRDGLVAVLAADPEKAGEALGAVKADFDVPPAAVDEGTIFDHLVASAPAPQDVQRQGDVAAGERAATVTFEHRYENGYGAHAPIETHTALAEVADGRATVWISTQTPFANQQEVAQALGLAPEAVRVVTPFVGGGFGGKSGSALQAVHAAKLSKALGRPVQVAWTRAEEFHHDAFRPAAVVTVKSGTNAAGRIVLWDCKVYSAGARSAEQLYDVPNNLVRTYGNWYRDSGGQHTLGTGPWRAPGANINVFARESQVDVMAARAKKDPLAFRLDNATEPRLRAVLAAAAERFRWTAGAAPSGRGCGIACGVDAGSYVAMCAEVAVDKATGRIRVKRIVCAQDMGQVVNPDGAVMQMEGCIAMGLGYALTETLRFKGGTVLDRGFDTYELPRFSGMPAIDCVLVKNDAIAPQGGGEPAIVPVGAAIANAVFDATGARVFRMPMTPDLVRQAIAGQATRD